MTQPVAIGVDLGGTKIAFAAVDRDGAILATHTEPTLAPESVDAVIGRIAGGIERLAADFDVAGIGIGAPGPVVNGIALNAVNLGWQGVPLVENVRAKVALDVPIWAQNDVNAGAVAELVFGAARGMTDFVYLAVGTGLGGGAVANGRLINGALGFAMEVGHASIDPHGRLCSCGNHGCVEMYCSGKGLLAGVREHLPEFPESLLTYESAAPAIITAMRAGDPLALRVLAEAADALGTTLAWCVLMLNPMLIVIGGGLGIAAYDLLAEPARAAMTARMIPDLAPLIQIAPSRIESSALGAAALVWHAVAVSD